MDLYSLVQFFPMVVIFNKQWLQNFHESKRYCCINACYSSIENAMANKIFHSAGQRSTYVSGPNRAARFIFKFRKQNKQRRQQYIYTHTHVHT